MINRKFIYAALVLLTLGFTACQQEEDFIPQEQEQEQEQVLRIATRSTSDESAAEAFTDDFTLELWSTTDNAKCETHSMTYTDGTGWNTVKSSILPANALAYKGSSVTDISYTDKWNYTVNLQLDQSDATKLADADVMIATGSANTESPLDLNFQHYYAKVTFSVELASEFNPETDVISGFDVVTCDGDHVNPYMDGKSYTAVIPANPYFMAGEHFALVTINGEQLDVEIPDEYANPNGSFVAGKHYTFDLKVGKDKVSVEQVSMNDSDSPFGNGWNNETDLK